MWIEGRTNPAGLRGGEDQWAGIGYVYSGVTCYSPIQQLTPVDCRGDTKGKGSAKSRLLSKEADFNLDSYSGS